MVDERAERQQEAERSVQQSQAGAQTVLGPLLQRQCAEEWDSTVGEGKDKRKWWRSASSCCRPRPTTCASPAP
ncbi:inner membrane CreD family protein [Ideonella paludis]|uniref:inner membrane CreD family protein n=1 Tax=Ideonella paludis TaxID=1233411 RepID=UPI0036445E03